MRKDSRNLFTISSRVKRKERVRGEKLFLEWFCRWWRRWWARGKNRVQKHATRSLRQQQHMSLLSYSLSRLHIFHFFLTHLLTTLTSSKVKNYKKRKCLIIVWTRHRLFTNAIFRAFQAPKIHLNWSKRTNTKRARLQQHEMRWLLFMIVDFPHFFPRVYLLCVQRVHSQNCRRCTMMSCSSVFFFLFLNKLLNGIKK